MGIVRVGRRACSAAYLSPSKPRINESAEEVEHHSCPNPKPSTPHAGAQDSGKRKGSEFPFSPGGSRLPFPHHGTYKAISQASLLVLSAAEDFSSDSDKSCVLFPHLHPTSPVRDGGCFSLSFGREPPHCEPETCSIEHNIREATAVWRQLAVSALISRTPPTPKHMVVQEELE